MTEQIDLLAAAEAVRAASTGTRRVGPTGEPVCGVCGGEGSVRAAKAGEAGWWRMPCPECPRDR